MAHVVDWDGADGGRCSAAPLDEAVPLTPEQEEGIRKAMASLEEGRGHSLDEVRERVLSMLKR